MTLKLDDIEIPSSVRPYNATAVVELSKSIAAIGLQSAPTVIEREGRYVLVAGRHRIEALRLLKHESVLVRVVDFDDLEARLWTIVENLHRAELTVAERAAQIAEYARFAKEKRESEKTCNLHQFPAGRGNEGGDRLVARDLGRLRAGNQARRGYRFPAGRGHRGGSARSALMTINPPYWPPRRSGRLQPKSRCLMTSPNAAESQQLQRRAPYVT